MEDRAKILFEARAAALKEGCVEKIPNVRDMTEMAIRIKGTMRCWKELAKLFKRVGSDKLSKDMLDGIGEVKREWMYLKWLGSGKKKLLL